MLAINIPDLRRTAGGFHLNGLYRHGFLMAPVLAVEVVQQLGKEMAGKR
jgi:glycine oxidase